MGMAAPHAYMETLTDGVPMSTLPPGQVMLVDPTSGMGTVMSPSPPYLSSSSSQFQSGTGYYMPSHYGNPQQEYYATHYNPTTYYPYPGATFPSGVTSYDTFGNPIGAYPPSPYVTGAADTRVGGVGGIPSGAMGSSGTGVYVNRGGGGGFGGVNANAGPWTANNGGSQRRNYEAGSGGGAAWGNGGRRDGSRFGNRGRKDYNGPNSSMPLPTATQSTPLRKVGHTDEPGVKATASSVSVVTPVSSNGSTSSLIGGNKKDTEVETFDSD